MVAFFIFRKVLGTPSFAAKNSDDTMKKFQIPNQNRFAKKNQKKAMQITELGLSRFMIQFVRSRNLSLVPVKIAPRGNTQPQPKLRSYESKP